jgi:hypothetical protein
MAIPRCEHCDWMNYHSINCPTQTTGLPYEKSTKRNPNQYEIEQIVDRVLGKIGIILVEELRNHGT